MKLPEWIKLYRKEHGLSMQALADMCGFSKAYIGILEKGINPTTKKPISPTMQTLQKIADGIGVDINDFIKLLDADQPITIAPAQSTPILSNHDKLMIEAYQKAKPKDKYTVDTVLDEYTNGKLIEAATKEQKELEKEHIPEAM